VTSRQLVRPLHKGRGVAREPYRHPCRGHGLRPSAGCGSPALFSVVLCRLARGII